MERQARQAATKRGDSAMDRFTKNVVSSVGREVGRVIHVAQWAYSKIRGAKRMANVVVFFAQGFEEIEGLATVDILRRAGHTVHTVGAWW